MPPNRPSNSIRRSSLVTLLAGIALVAVYFALKLLDVGKIGDPTDIGGGGILGVGYAVTAVGVVLLGRDYLRYRSGRQ
jgi:hypothetical protein